MNISNIEKVHSAEVKFYKIVKLEPILVIVNML